MSRQFGIHHGQCQPRGITPPCQEGHQSATLPFLRGRADPAAAACQSRTDEFSRPAAIIRDIDVRHRLGDMGLPHALVTKFPFERTTRLTTTATPATYPLGREVRIVDQAPRTDTVQRLVDNLARVLLL